MQLLSGNNKINAFSVISFGLHKRAPRLLGSIRDSLTLSSRGRNLKNIVRGWRFVGGAFTGTFTLGVVLESSSNFEFKDGSVYRDVDTERFLIDATAGRA